MKYNEVKLSDLQIEIIDGDRGKNYPKKTEMFDYGHTLFLNNKNIINDYLDASFGEFITQGKSDSLRKGKLERYDIVMSTRGSVGNIGYFSENIRHENIRINSGMVILRNKDNRVDTKFLYVLLKSNFMKKRYTELITGSVQNQLPIKDLKNLFLILPPLLIQEKITSIIQSVENKITINNQIIVTLEEIASTLFKNWFVNFEFPDEDGNPYKSCGGKMVESDLGEIPEGWIVGNLDRFVSTNLSGDWGKADKQGNYTKEVTIIRGADIPELKLGGNGNMPRRFILQKNFDNKYIKENDIVIEISGGSPTQSTGRSLHVTPNLLKRISGDLICTNFCRIIRLEDEYSSFYFSELFDSLYQKNVFFNYENGTTGIKNLDYKSVLENLPMKICTNKKLLRHFYDLNLKIDKHKQSLAIQNKKLEQLRDILLPKLLSGEIELPVEEGV